MSKRGIFKSGTLLRDMDKIGVIIRTIETGRLNTPSAVVNWRFNYEIHYTDGTVTIMGHETLIRLLDKGIMEILEDNEQV